MEADSVNAAIILVLAMADRPVLKYLHNLDFTETV